MSSQNFSMKSYMQGALLLTIAALIVKVLSAAYRVPFQNLVGDQGVLQSLFLKCLQTLNMKRYKVEHGENRF